MAGGAIAAWTLHIQHQREGTYYKLRRSVWNFELAALQGSSYLKLPGAPAWAVRNANYDHVHHLSARIANYHLRAAHEQQPMFAHTPSSPPAAASTRRARGCGTRNAAAAVGYPARRARPAAATDPVEEPLKSPS